MAETSLSVLMKEIDDALKLDDSNYEKEAYIKYVGCVYRVATNLVLYIKGAGGDVVINNKVSRQVKLIEQCVERVVSLVEKMDCNKSGSIPSTPETSRPFPPQPDLRPMSASVQDLSSACPTVPEQLPIKRSESSNVYSQQTASESAKIVHIFSAPVPALPDDKSLHTFTKKKALTPTEVAHRQNQVLLTAYKARMNRKNRKDFNAFNYNLTIQRRMAENLAIAQAQEEALAKKIQLRQKRFEEEAARRFATPTGMSEEEQEQRQIYKQILEYENNTLWLQSWRRKLEENPEDPILINRLVQEILRCSDHPFTQLLKKYQFKVYEKLYPLTADKNVEIQNLKVPLAEELWPGEDDVIDIVSESRRTMPQSPTEANSRHKLSRHTRIKTRRIKKKTDSSNEKSENSCSENESESTSKDSEKSDDFIDPLNVNKKSKLKNTKTTTKTDTGVSCRKDKTISANDNSYGVINKEGFNIKDPSTTITDEANVLKYDETKEINKLNDVCLEKNENKKTLENENEETVENENKETAEIENKEIVKSDNSIQNNSNTVNEENKETTNQDNHSCVKKDDSQGTNKDKVPEIDNIEANSICFKKTNKCIQDKCEINEETAEEPAITEVTDLDNKETQGDLQNENNDDEASGDIELSDNKTVYENKNEPLEDSRNLEDWTNDTKQQLEEGLKKNEGLQTQLEFHRKQAQILMRQATKDYETYLQENFDLSDLDESSDESEDDDVILSAETTTSSSLPYQPPPDNVVDSPSTNKTPEEVRQIKDLNIKAYQRHLKTITEDIQHYLDKLLVVMVIAYEPLDTPVGKDQCSVSMEEPFFKPIWKTLLTLFRTVNFREERVLACVMTSYTSATPQVFKISKKLCLESTESDEKPYQKAIDKLKQLENYYTMLSKLDCVVKVCQLICECVDDYYKAKEGADDQQPKKKAPSLGADDLLPILSYVVTQSSLPSLVSECHAMSEFIHEGYVMGEEGYCLTSLRTALNFVVSLFGTSPKDL